MKTPIYNSTLILFLLFSFTHLMGNQQCSQQMIEKSKTMNFSFEVHSDVLLKVDNKYGLVHVDTWDKNYIEAEIQIIVGDNNEDYASRKLDNIEIDVSESKEKVSFETIINKSGSSWKEWLWGGNNNSTKKIEINYRISMPKTGAVDLENHYGTIYLADLLGNAEIELKYGSLNAGKLTGANSEIDVAYSNMDIEEMRFGDLTIQYSDAELLKSEKLELLCQYSDVSLGEVDDLNLDAQYGDLEIESAINVKADLNYAGLEIEELLNELEVDANYAPSIEVHYISDKFESVSVDGNYSSVTLKFQTSSSFELEADANYGDIRVARDFADGLDIDKNKSGRSHSIHGHVGSAQGNAKVEVDLNYGSLSIEKD